jgi:hypothetical protein
MLDVKFVDGTKSKAKSGSEPIKMTDMTVFAELIQFGPPALPWENIDGIEINGVAVARHAPFLGYVTDLPQLVRSLRHFPAGVPLTFNLVMVTANDFLSRKLDIPSWRRCKALSQEELLFGVMQFPSGKHSCYEYDGDEYDPQMLDFKNARRRYGLMERRGNHAL